MSSPAWTHGDSWTVGALVEERLASEPEREIFDVNGEQWTARALFGASDRFANAMRDYGLARGDRVATLVENSSEAVVSQFGAVRLGGVSVPINTAYKGEYLRHQLADSGARVLVIDGDVADRAVAIADAIDTLDHVVVLGTDRARIAELATPGTNWHGWDDVMAADDTPKPAVTAPTDLHCFIYTGGTTGLSKGCVINNNYCVTLAKQIAVMWGRGSDDVVWTPLPLFHFNAVSVVLVGTLLTGGRAAIYKKFSVSNFWPEINRTGATHASTLGSMVTLIANDPVRPEAPDSGLPDANTTLRFMSGVPMPTAVAEKCVERFGIRPFDAAYGTTEGSLWCWLPPGMQNKPNAAGIVNDEYWDVRIFDDDDDELPIETPGEIVARPKKPNVMFDGYWGRPEATAEMFRNLWVHSGDIGRFDADGFLYFMDRKADYMRRRGENVSSYELEEVFIRHPDVADVAVYAVPSPVTEDDIMVAVELVDGSSLTEEALYRWSIEAIPYFALPRYVEIRSELPRSEMKKILKAQLREEGVGPHTWDADQSGIEVQKR
jgi:crotonobetaine/carnitine-CoA ligase